MITFLALLIGVLIGYIVGHDVAVLKTNTKLQKEMKPLLEGMARASEAIGKPTDVHVIHHDEPFPRGGRLQ